MLRSLGDGLFIQICSSQLLVEFLFSTLLTAVFKLYCCYQSLKLPSFLSFDPEQFINLSQKLHPCRVIFSFDTGFSCLDYISFWFAFGLLPLWFRVGLVPVLMIRFYHPVCSHDILQIIIKVNSPKGKSVCLLIKPDIFCCGLTSLIKGRDMARFPLVL